MTYRVLLKPGWQAIPDAGIIVRNRWLRGPEIRPYSEVGVAQARADMLNNARRVAEDLENPLHALRVVDRDKTVDELLSAQHASDEWKQVASQPVLRKAVAMAPEQLPRGVRSVEASIDLAGMISSHLSPEERAHFIATYITARDKQGVVARLLGKPNIREQLGIETHHVGAVPNRWGTVPATADEAATSPQFKILSDEGEVGLATRDTSMWL